MEQTNAEEADEKHGGSGMSSCYEIPDNSHISTVLKKGRFCNSIVAEYTLPLGERL